MQVWYGPQAQKLAQRAAEVGAGGVAERPPACRKFLHQAIFKNHFSCNLQASQLQIYVAKILLTL